VTKIYLVLLMVGVCAFTSTSLQLLAEPVSTTASISIGGVSINLRYSLEEGVLKIGYSTGDKECQLVFSSTQRMGLLINVAETEIAFSLKFLDEGEAWPQAEALEEETYILRSRFEFPGWVVVVVQQSEQGGETE